MRNVWWEVVKVVMEWRMEGKMAYKKERRMVFGRLARAVKFIYMCVCVCIKVGGVGKYHLFSGRHLLYKCWVEKRKYAVGVFHIWW